jgi:hypothetical protein
MSQFCSSSKMWPCKCRSKIRECVLVVSLPLLLCCCHSASLQTKTWPFHYRPLSAVENYICLQRLYRKKGEVLLRNRHVMKKWRYSSTHSYPRQMVVSGQFHPRTPLTPYKMSLETHFMGAGATPYMVKDRKVSDHRGGSNLDSSFVQPGRVDRAHCIGEVNEVSVGPVYATKAYGGLGQWDGGKWSASYPGRFTPGE